MRRRISSLISRRFRLGQLRILLTEVRSSSSFSALRCRFGMRWFLLKVLTWYLAVAIVHCQCIEEAIFSLVGLAPLLQLQPGEPPTRLDNNNRSHRFYDQFPQYASHSWGAETKMPDPGGPSLNSTLILALTQSEALQRQLADSTRTMERLKRENEKIKQELADIRLAQRPTIDRPDLMLQLESLFRKDAEKQAEIDSLRKRLARSKDGQTQIPNTSSPIVSTDERTSINLSRKRARLGSSGQKHPPLREISINSSPPGRPRQCVQPKGLLSDRGAEAIPFIAEDGIDHNEGTEQVGIRKITRSHSGSPNMCLQALLSTPLAMANSTTTTTPILRAVGAEKGPEDDEPLRCRPLHRLNLSHFKVNPKYNGDLDFAFQDVTRSKEARKCLLSCTKPECCGASFNALAKTLPPDAEISEDDLLSDFLGPGSEGKIKWLTPLARTNLVFEARAKRLANAYGRMHRAKFEAPSSPPDFWNSDIPGTQEMRASREQAKAKEREEVGRRFEEAMRCSGRWLFADE